jgi:hypothetical protein
LPRRIEAVARPVHLLMDRAYEGSFRRVFSRFEKLALMFLHLALIVDALR